MADPEDDETGEGEGSNGFKLELLQSYLAFARRAIRLRWFMTGLVFVIGLSLTVAAVMYMPRTFTCKTVLMGFGSPILDGRDTTSPLAGADGLILRHENLEAIIRDTDLVRKFDSRRSGLLKLKDRIMEALHGELDQKTKVGVLLGTLESKLSVTPERGDQQGQLTISVDWTDGQTAAELAEAARESFVRARHTAEMSAFEDKATILDAHAGKLRDEVGVLAEQVMAAGRQKAAEKEAETAATPPAEKPATPRSVRLVSRGPDPLLIEEVSGLRERLAADKPKLAELENDWARRLREEQGKLADLQLRFTSSHPQVVTEQERVNLLSQPPAEIATLRAEVKTIEGDIKARELMSGRTGSVGAAAGGSTEPLSTAIVQALERDDVDPALRAQLSSAVTKYGDLRNDILMGRIELDTAQAAFNHRYQVIIPADAPSKPTKPKPALIFIGGLLATLLLSLTLPILLELRGGVLVERWQVYHLQLPVLAELKLPPHND
jgi:uncharacterized protein involved in exopolysaccharide biosynthesis